MKEQTVKCGSATTSQQNTTILRNATHLNRKSAKDFFLNWSGGVRRVNRYEVI